MSTAGPHEVTVLAGGAPVPGSPFRVEVRPGQVAPGACQLFGPGLSAIQLGRDMRIFVALADAFGNAISDPESIDAAKVKVLSTDGHPKHNPTLCRVHPAASLSLQKASRRSSPTCICTAPVPVD